MTLHTRLIAAVVVTAAGMTGLVLAQGAGTPPPPRVSSRPRQLRRPARGAGQGQRGAGQAGRQGAGGRRGGFTQFTRELAPQDVIVRGKSLYEANCASCHCGGSARRTEGHEPAALGRRAAATSTASWSAPAIAKHTPALTLVEATRSRSPNTSTAFTRRWAVRAARRDAIRPTSS